MPRCYGYAARDASAKFSPIEFDRRETGEQDVKIDIIWAGICHSDLHTVKGDWGPAKYPVVTGHEIVGIVSEVGSKVTKFKLGDKAAVGCMVGSCRSCKTCSNDEEQFCKGCVYTYNSPNPTPDGLPSQGGYSAFITVNEHFALRFPDNLDMASGAPLLCAGITTYSPLVEHGLNKPGKKVGVLGLGGLGHIGVKLAAAMGAEVTVISTSEHKKQDALALGATHFLNSKDAEAMKAAAGTLDGILDTAAVKKPMAPYIDLLAPHGTLVQIGGIVEPYSDISPFQMILGNRRLAGSAIGGIKQTQEMLDFCAEKEITCDIEKIDIADINSAMDRLENNDVRYRFVIDIKNTLKE